MATHKGSEGIIKSGANTVAEVRSYTINVTADTLEDTTMGDSARTYLPSLTSWNASVEAYWDETDTTGQGSFTVGSSVTLNVYPEGASSGDTYYSGTAIITGLTVTGSFDGMVEASFSLQGTGTLTTTSVGA